MFPTKQLFFSVEKLPLEVFAIGLKRRNKVGGADGFESTKSQKTKEFCGATWPSRVLKGKEGNYCPLHWCPGKSWSPPAIYCP
jgi:hypothetical protein